MTEKVDKRARFLALYANLPMKLRSEIILILDKETLTWNAAYIEVRNNTKKSERILEKLYKMGFI